MAIEIKKAVSLILLSAIAAVFLAAGVLKLLNPSQFALDIYHYRLLPWPLCVLIAIYLPWLECACAGMLVFRKYRTVALALLLLMSIVFLLAICSAMTRGLNISCGCFGGGTGHMGAAVLRDAVIMAAIILMLKVESRTRKLLP